MMGWDGIEGVVLLMWDLVDQCVPPCSAATFKFSVLFAFYVALLFSFLWLFRRTMEHPNLCDSHAGLTAAPI